jgi:hypothetical protein
LIAARTVEFLLARSEFVARGAVFLQLSLGTVPFIGAECARLGRLVNTIHADSDRALATLRPPAIVFHETRSSETRPAGWIFDSFPERNRGHADPIVTFPNLVAPLRARVLAAYPQRECWYFHRDPLSERAELKRCADARELMDRPFKDDLQPLWIRPTSYALTSFDPLRNMIRGHVRDARGRRIALCCLLSDFRALGAEIPDEAFEHCVPDHP